MIGYAMQIQSFMIKSKRESLLVCVFLLIFLKIAFSTRYLFQ